MFKRFDVVMLPTSKNPYVVIRTLSMCEWSKRMLKNKPHRCTPSCLNDDPLVWCFDHADETNNIFFSSALKPWEPKFAVNCFRYRNV